MGAHVDERHRGGGRDDRQASVRGGRFALSSRPPPSRPATLFVHPSLPHSATVRSLLVALLVLQITERQAERLDWVPNPRAADATWVSDPSHHLSATAVSAINAEISALEA